MNSKPLEEFESETTEDRMEQYIESIPDGHAVSIRVAIEETGMTSRQQWLKIGGSRVFDRYYHNNPCKVLVNSKTAKKLAK